jgi:hypothetical protein
LATRYLNSAILPLLQNLDEKDAKSDLDAILVKAADQTYSLWTQKLELIPIYMYDDEIGNFFEHQDELIERHDLHGRYLDENAARLNGMPILVMIHPALVVEQEGEIPPKKAVLKRAVCWMGPYT